ncbi:hypothetical protein Lser_V15G11694 [Lactuca serriola]
MVAPVQSSSLAAQPPAMKTHLKSHLKIHLPIRACILFLR